MREGNTRRKHHFDIYIPFHGYVHIFSFAKKGKFWRMAEDLRFSFIFG